MTHTITYTCTYECIYIKERKDSFVCAVEEQKRNVQHNHRENSAA